MEKLYRILTGQCWPIECKTRWNRGEIKWPRANGPGLITCLNYCFDIELIFKGPVYLNYRGIWWIVISSPSWIVELKEKLTNKTQVDDISEDDDENESTSLLLLFGFLLLDCDTFFHL